MLTILAAALPLRQAVELTAQVTGAKKNALYQLGLITNQSE
jgi:16S rRNA C1402 (ribose-2'-O) methylase RsmI